MALHGVLLLVLLPLFPPDEALPGGLGWALAVGGALLNLATAVWLLRARQVRFGVMLAIAYAGVAQLVMVQLLADAVLPYQALMLIWVGAAAVQPPRRALTLLSVVLAATLAPILLGEPSADARDLIGRALLFAAIGVVLIAYVAYVRGQRVALRAQEQDARATPTRPRNAYAIFNGSPTRHCRTSGSKTCWTSCSNGSFRSSGPTSGAVLIRDEDASRLELRARRGVPEDLEGDLYRSIADRLAGRLALSRRPLVLEQSEAGGALASHLARAGVQSLLGLPLILDRQLLGVLYVGRRTHRPFSDDDAALLQLVGDRVALAVDRARLFEQERHIAETLQRSLLPEQLPRIPGLAVAVRYLPAGAGMEVGGDWFDMFELSDGRVVLAMGDVVGRGVRAAAMMGKLRTSLEAYAYDGRSPHEVLERLHSLMERQHRAEMATLLYVSIDADRGGRS